MINKVELGSVNSRNKTPKSNVGMQKRGQQSFTGFADLALRGIQACEANPMLNVTVLDCTTAIFPRTFFETAIGSKKKDENGNVQRKLNIMAGFEALRREGSGLFINCIIPSFVVIGAAKLLNKPVMGKFSASNLTKCWANGESIKSVEKYYNAAKGATNEEKIFNTLKSITTDLEGVDGDISKGGLKQFKNVLEGDETFDRLLHRTAKNIVSTQKSKTNYSHLIYKYILKKTGIAENIRFVGENSFSANNLSHLCDSTCELLKGVVKEKANNNIKNAEDLSRYFKRSKNLVNAKSASGLLAIISLAISAQPINRWITHKLSGKKGAPIYNDDKERILTPEEKKKLNIEKAFAVPLMWAVAGLSMIMDRPSLKMFQFKGLFPTMDQARLISAATFSSRIATSEDSNELPENTIRDIATFCSFYFFGDYAAKGIATAIEKHNKHGIKLLNRLETKKENANIVQKFWDWAKHTKMKSTDELNSIANKALRTKATNMRATCQLGNLAFSLLALGVFIPIYTKAQTNKKELRKKELAMKTQAFEGSFTQNLIKQNSTETFKPFFTQNRNLKKAV